MKLLKTSLFAFLAAILLSACAKEYSSEILRPATGNWSFTNASLNYSGFLDTVYQTSGIGSNVMYILGRTDDGSQYFQLKLYAKNFAPGTYYASQNQVTFNYSVPAKSIYDANGLIGEFTVNLIAMDSSKIQGTFSGTARDSANKLIQITNGKFSTY